MNIPLPPLQDSTLERCENGHPLSVVVHETESTVIWEQDEGATLLLFRNAKLSTRAHRTLTVLCEHGCDVPTGAQKQMLHQLRNSE